MLAHVTSALLVAFAAAQAPGIPHGGGPCVSEWNCSLGGICDAATSTCVCDAWVTGAQCDLLNLAPPADENAGLQVPEYYAWGGHALLSPSDGLYHGLFSFMCRHATLAEWTTKSSIWHATSTTPAGPYSLVDMVAQPWSHNAMLSANPAGGYLLYQIGDAAVPAPEWEPCFNATSARPLPVASGRGAADVRRPQKQQPSEQDGSGIYVRSAPDLKGPWTLEVGEVHRDAAQPPRILPALPSLWPLQSAAGITLNVTGSWATGGANGGNPAPFFFDNGASWGAGGGGRKGGKGREGMASPCALRTTLFLFRHFGRHRPALLLRQPLPAGLGKHLPRQQLHRRR